MSSDKKEECGLFGIFGDAEAVQKTYFGLYSLQHRGQESAGIASSDGDFIQCYKGSDPRFFEDFGKGVGQIQDQCKYHLPSCLDAGQ